MPLFNQPASGRYLCAPTQYAPAAQTLLGVLQNTPVVPGLSTTVASGSNGGTISGIASWAAPSAGVLAVASTTGFPASGTLNVAASGSTVAVVTYTGTSGGNTFTGCAYVSGSAAGTVATGGVVVSADGALISTGSFTAPASGNVLVAAHLIFQCTSASTSVAWALLGHGTSTQYGYLVNCPVQASNNRTFANPVFPVTGLTPGTAYNFDLAAAVVLGQTLTVYAYGISTASPNLGSVGNGAPAVMTVQSA